MNPAFERYVGIDYCGADTPTSSLKGLHVYESQPSGNQPQRPDRGMGEKRRRGDLDEHC